MRETLGYQVGKEGWRTAQDNSDNCAIINCRVPSVTINTIQTTNSKEDHYK